MGLIVTHFALEGDLDLRLLALSRDLPRRSLERSRRDRDLLRDRRFERDLISGMGCKSFYH